MFLWITLIILDFKIYSTVYIYIQVSDTCTTVSTVLPILSVWDPRMHYKFWYTGSVLWKAWWWLNTVKTCCHKNILCNKLLCLTEIYTLYEHTNWQYHEPWGYQTQWEKASLLTESYAFVKYINRWCTDSLYCHFFSSIW